MKISFQDRLGGGDTTRRKPRGFFFSLVRHALMISAFAAFALNSANLPAWAKPPVMENEPASKRGKLQTEVGRSVEKDVLPIPESEVKGPHAKIKPDETIHDFGPVWVGPALKHSFKIKNEGDAPLEISKVKPSCGCTIAGDYPKKLDPGQEGEFPFSMVSTKLRGAFEKGITISSNDPSTPELRLKLKGEVKRYVEIVPASANFGKLTSPEAQERIINITNNTDNPLKLTLVPPPDSKFKFEMVEKSPGKQFDLHVTAAPPFEEGTLKSNVTIKTNVEAQNELQVEVMAVVPARLEVQPTEVTLTRPKPDAPTPAEGLSRVIKFTNYGKTPAKVLEATVDDPAVTVTVTERKAGEAYTVQVQMPPGYAPPPEGRTITLKTDDSQKPVITVPIKAPAAAAPSVTERKQAKPAESLVGQPAPVFNLQTLESKPVNNQTLANNVAVLNFFAPNCGFCKKQIPRMEPIREKYADKGVRFINVSEKMGAKEYSQDEVVEMIKGLGFKGELALDHTNAVGPLFKANSFPTMIVVGKTGKVEAVNSGNVADLETRLTGQIDALLSGKPVPADAVAAKTPSVSDPTKITAPEAPKRAQPQDLVGQAAPVFTLTTVDGKPLSNAEVAKAPATVLNFFAPNCGFCKKQIPRLETVRKMFVDKGVRFVNVVETMGKEFTQEETDTILKSLGAELEVARDPGNKVGPLFNATGYPTMVVVGKSGKVEAVNVGNVADLETRLQGQLDALIAGKPIPTVAPVAQAAKKDTPPAPEAPKDAPKPTTPTERPPAKVAPTFALTTTDGKPVSNAELANAPATVLNFIAPNCGYCKKQIPRLETVRKTYAEKGVRFVNVVETMGKEFTPEETQAILKELGAGLEVAHDPGNKVGPPFGATGYPTMVVVGKSGKIEATNVGNIPDLETKLPGQLDALIAGKPIPTQFADAPPAPPRPKPQDLVGKPTATFSLTTTTGKPVSNTELANAPATVLNFFAPNCGYCKKQIPRVEAVRKTYAEKGVRFINVVETMGKEFPEEETLNILKELGSELEVARDSGNKVGSQFNVSGFPTMFLVGKTGKVEAVHVGNVGDLETKLPSQLDALIAGKPVSQAAVTPPAQPAPPGQPTDPATPPQPPQRPAMQLIGQPAPAFTIDTLEGKKVSSDDFKNHPATVLNFVAPNCGFCKKQMPNVEAVRAEYEAKGVRFVNVSQKMGAKEFTNEEIVDVFKGVGSRIELAKDTDNKVGQLYKAVSFPTMVVVNKNGKIEHVHIGAKADLEKSLKDQLDGMIAGKPAGGAPGGN